MITETTTGKVGTTGKTAALRSVQQLHFALIDLGLYLNTHPDCEEALALYEKTRHMYVASKKKYEEFFGPLTYEGVNTEKDKWSWINDPWPWEGEY